MIDRFLVVSAGSIGRRHIKNLRNLNPDSKIAILRLASTSNAELPSGADFQFFNLKDSLTFNPYAAIVCSPATTHLYITTALIKKDIPVLVEKPLAETITGVETLMTITEKHSVPLMVAYNLRFLPSLIETYRLIKSGEIGTILGARAEVGQYLPNWRLNSRYQDTVSAHKNLGGGPLLELSHEIDYLYWIFGMPSRVTAVGGRYSELEIDVEDMVSLNMEYKQPRRLITIHLDFIQHSTTRTCKFIGSEGTLIWDGINDTINLYCAKSNNWSYKTVPANPDKNMMYIDELQHFLDCVNQRKKPAIDIYQGYDVLRLIEAAKESIKHRSTIEIK